MERTKPNPYAYGGKGTLSYNANYYSLINQKTMVDFKKGTNAKPNVDKPNLTAQEVHGAMVLGAEKPKGMELLTPDDIWDLMDSVPDEELEEMNGGEYFKFDELQPGKPLSVLVTGARTTQMDGKETKIVVFETRDGKKWIHASTLLVNAVQNLKQLPAYLRIYNLGKKKAGQGNYFDLDIRTIPVAAF